MQTAWSSFTARPAEHADVLQHEALQFGGKFDSFSSSSNFGIHSQSSFAQTVDEHMELSFSHIMKHWKRNPNQPGAAKIPGSRNVLLRFYPPQSSLGELIIH